MLSIFVSTFTKICFVFYSIHLYSALTHYFEHCFVWYLGVYDLFNLSTTEQNLMFVFIAAIDVDITYKAIMNILKLKSQGTFVSVSILNLLSNDFRSIISLDFLLQSFWEKFPKGLLSTNTYWIWLFPSLWDSEIYTLGISSHQI